MITQAPRGTADWYGENMYRREKIESICFEQARRYHIHQIQTPVFEHTVLFARGVGETTDVVQKEMYTFEDRSGRSITLKPEGTAGVIRAYLEHSMYAEPGISKLCYVTPAFRYEKPQSGRLRQHHQFGVEYIGSESPLVEAELISLVSDIISEVGLKDMEVHINSIGCKDCRREYNKALLAYLEEHRGSLCKTCQERMERNPLRVIDCKNETCKEIVKDAPRTVDYLDEGCRAHFEELQSLLTELNIPFQVDTGIVRGLDYYTRTVFEFVDKEGFTLCGGGRYDGLVEQLGAQPTPAVGFAIGLERFILLLQSINAVEVENPVDVYFCAVGDEAVRQSMVIAEQLRDQISGIRILTNCSGGNFKKQFKRADKSGALFALVLADDELAKNEIGIKNLRVESEQLNVKISAVAEELKKLLGVN